MDGLGKILESKASGFNVPTNNYQQSKPEDDTLSTQLAGKQDDFSSTGEEVVSYEDNCKVTGEDGKKYTGSKTVIRKSDGTLVTKIVYTDKSGNEVQIEQSSKDENLTFNGKSVTVTHSNSTIKYGGKLHSTIKQEESKYHITTETTVYESNNSSTTNKVSKMKVKNCKIPVDIKRGLHIGESLATLGAIRGGDKVPAEE
ncbi:MAG: hypothetical protein LUB59_01695 [Candidatus Gastranaerophilales bacterium]|nr:hypothetical protein [Candidatus Gastranaerophilales bacterium]